MVATRRPQPRIAELADIGVTSRIVSRVIGLNNMAAIGTDAGERRRTLESPSPPAFAAGKPLSPWSAAAPQGSGGRYSNYAIERPGAENQ